MVTSEGGGTALPSRELVLRAVCGVLDEDDPLLAAAHQLSRLHEQREAGTAETSDIDWQRARLVCEIDRWVGLLTPPPSPEAPLHTESVGTVVDRLAQLAVLTYLALARGCDDRLADSQQRLHELSWAYDDLIAEIRTGTRRLPGVDLD
ncbi:DUF4254 domain-containing protein [Nocardia puris]|uniref:DUF4254 domain-containing protein n=1 Tax=Nocardia puris TaxID=208602 RepID=UPI0014762615|nr:DUF4254 domain-containing protein [Nocardia puris]MBF6210186.1 DUF4254 domain-containing protein [Nocardia puris]MBF6367263.1 DUF4254 domain-containing protein [Nocardia puris]MBF6457447.1 DUF4254 domain-containing protein [Nocardia puris]